MFSKSKLVRLASLVCLAATWLPIGNGLFHPTQAKALEIIRVGPIVRCPIVRVGPVVPVGPVVGPIVRVGPVYPRPWYRGWYGRWYR